MDLSVVVPMYQCAGFVAARLPLLASHLDSLGRRHELLVVDDGSTDGSGDLVAGLRLPACDVLRLPHNRGKFAALAAGVARSRGACVLFTDADVPFELPAIDAMVDCVARTGAHAAIGDRSLPQSDYAARQPWARRAASAAFTLWVRLLVTPGLSDTQCGLKALRGDVARAVFPLLREPRFAGDVELLYVLRKYGLDIRRVPVRVAYQAPSSLRLGRDGLRMALATLLVPWRFRCGRYASPALARLRHESQDPPPATRRRDEGLPGQPVDRGVRR